MGPTIRWRGAILLTLVALLAGSGPAAGQGEDVEQHRLTFRAYEALGPGEFSLVEGTTGATAHEFYASDLDVLQPVGVVLQARDPGADLRLELRSYSWTDPIRQSATDETGRAGFRVRTSPDLYVRVVAPDGAEEPYQLAVWKGEPITPAELGRSLEPAVVPASEHGDGSGAARGGDAAGDDGDDGDDGGGPASSAVLWGALLLGGGLAATVALRKRGAG